MANKAKLINLAQKAMSRGQWDKAVSLLERVLAEDPGDVRTMLKAGDVYAKKGDRARAAEVYRHVAEHHAEQGFFLKAVAVYKQILKLDPKNGEAALRIAELHEQLGLAQDAMVHFHLALPMLEEQGQHERAISVLERMLDLDRENVAARIKLAETLSRLERRGAAVEHFAIAAQILKQQVRIEDYVKVAERLIFHDASRLDVVKDLAKLYLSRGDTKRGLAKLQICFRETPRDVETLSLLAKAFADLGQIQKTVYVYRELARVHQEEGRPGEAREIHRLVLQHQPDDPEALRALGLIDDAGLGGSLLPGLRGSASVVDFDLRLEPPSDPRSLIPGPFPENATGALPIDASQDLLEPTLEPPIEAGVLPGSLYLDGDEGRDALVAGHDSLREHELGTTLGNRAGERAPSMAAGGRAGERGPSMAPAPRRAESAGHEGVAERSASSSWGTSPRDGDGDPAASLIAPRLDPRPRPSAPPPGASSSSSRSSDARPSPSTSDLLLEQAVRDGLPPPPRRHPAEDEVERIIREADVYIRYNLPGRAIEHLQKAVRADPNSVLAYRRLHEVYLSMNDWGRAAEAVANVMQRLAQAQDKNGEAEARAELERLAPNHPSLRGELARAADQFGAEREEPLAFGPGYPGSPPRSASSGSEAEVGASYLRDSPFEPYPPHREPYREPYGPRPEGGPAHLRGGRDAHLSDEDVDMDTGDFLSPVRSPTPDFPDYSDPPERSIRYRGAPDPEAAAALGAPVGSRDLSELDEEPMSDAAFEVDPEQLEAAELAPEYLEALPPEETGAPLTSPPPVPGEGLAPRALDRATYPPVWSDYDKPESWEPISDFRAPPGEAIPRGSISFAGPRAGPIAGSSSAEPPFEPLAPPGRATDAPLEGPSPAPPAPGGAGAPASGAPDDEDLDLEDAVAALEAGRRLEPRPDDAAAIAPPAPPRASTPGDLDDELAEISFFLDTGLIDEAREALSDLGARHPGHAGVDRMKARLAALDEGRPSDHLPPSHPSSDGRKGDLGSGEADRVKDFLEPVAPGRPGNEREEIRTNPRSAGAEGARPPSLLEASPSRFAASKGSEEDDETEAVLSFLGSRDLPGGFEPHTGPSDEHYDQGMAYKQIGQLEEAAAAFRAAAEASPERAADALEMLGHCLVESHRLEEAVIAFEQALAASAPSFAPGTPASALRAAEVASTNLRYELGDAHEKLGDFAAARAWFEACRERDPSHRDVESRLLALSRRGALVDPPEPIPEEPSALPQKRSKISYL